MYTRAQMYTGLENTEGNWEHVHVFRQMPCLVLQCVSHPEGDLFPGMIRLALLWHSSRRQLIYVWIVFQMPTRRKAQAVCGIRDSNTESRSSSG